jgi:hypothetical protein
VVLALGVLEWTRAWVSLGMRYIRDVRYIVE